MITAKDLKSKKETAIARTIFSKDREFWKRLKLVPGPLATPCWVCTGTRFKNGYGRVFRSLDGLRYSKAHRYAYALSKEHPKDLMLHKCDVKLCCNPTHLYDGSHTQNMLDAVERKTMPSGKHHARSVLSEKQVANIRMLDSCVGKIHVELLCALYGISKQTFFRIRNGTKYPNVPAADRNEKLIKKYKAHLELHVAELRASQGKRKEVSDTVWIWRHDVDRQMCYYHQKILGNKQDDTAAFFRCSRNSVRNCVSKVAAEGLPVLTHREFEAALANYREYRPV